MKYYKVINKNDIHDYFNGFTGVYGELFTEKERNSKLRYVSDDNFEIVNINKNNTCKIFGCRYECN